eukprot:NODE_174_length_14184_cov_0.583671.p12 type:complete len:101 gc:universal NODE_174_length_14184_cov_0.583671:11614-11312(-)
MDLTPLKIVNLNSQIQFCVLYNQNISYKIKHFLHKRIFELFLRLASNWYLDLIYHNSLIRNFGFYFYGIPNKSLGNIIQKTWKSWFLCRPCTRMLFYWMD